MRRRLCVVLLAIGMIIIQIPGAVVFADSVETPVEPEAALSHEETAAESAPAETEEAEAPEAVSEPVPEEPSESKAEKVTVSDSETRLETAKAMKAGTKDVYIDNTVDNSKSYVTATVHITGSGGKQAGYDTEQEVYSNDAAVTYSNPKTSQVQGMINDAYTKAYNTANDIKKRGKTGEVHMATAQSTGKVWDNRKYTTVEDGDAVLIGDSDYLIGAYGVNEDYTRTHIASGDYGKETFYEVQADGWVSGWSITVTDDGNGTASSDIAESLAEETVKLTASPSAGYRFKEWQVISGGAELSDNSAASATFKMPYADVEIKAVFEPEHTHTLVKTDKVEPTCSKAGTEAYWTCSECGRMFSDEAGTEEISKPISIAATGHDWGDWEIVKEPTETEPGQRVRVCRNNSNDVQVEPIPQLEVSYSNISGAGAEYVLGSGTPLKFVYKRSVNDDKTFGQFSGITIDGEEPGADTYTSESGSVIVTLSPDYLDTLEEGSHTITASFNDGNDVTVNFTVSDPAEDEEQAAEPEDDSVDDSDSGSTSGGSSSGSTGSGSGSASSSPKTADENHLGMWAAVFAACIAALAAAVRKRRA